MKAHDYDIIGSPRSRLPTLGLGRFMARKHTMYGLLEVDVTAARRALRLMRRQLQDVSFTSWMIKTIGDCVARNRRAHAVQVREILNLTVAFNHDAIDGVPARKFMQDLVSQIEKG